MVIKPKIGGGYYSENVKDSDLDASVLALMGATPASNTFYVSPAFSGKSNPYFVDLEAALIANNAGGKTIEVYQGTYNLASSNSSISSALLKCKGAVTLNVTDMYYISNSTVEGAYFNLAGQINIGTSNIYFCDANTGLINIYNGTVRMDCPKTSPLNIAINNGAKLTGNIENVLSITVYNGTGLLTIKDSAGAISNQTSGTLKILNAPSATGIANYGNFSGAIKTIALGTNSIANFGTMKLEKCVLSNSAGYAIYGGTGSKTILKNCVINSSSNGYAINSASDVKIDDCTFSGKSSSGVSVITTGTLNAFNVEANGSVTGAVQITNALQANQTATFIVDSL